MVQAQVQNSIFIPFRIKFCVSKDSCEQKSAFAIPHFTFSCYTPLLNTQKAFNVKTISSLLCTMHPNYNNIIVHDPSGKAAWHI